MIHKLYFTAGRDSFPIRPPDLHGVLTTNSFSYTFSPGRFHSRTQFPGCNSTSCPSQHSELPCDQPSPAQPSPASLALPSSAQLIRPCPADPAQLGLDSQWLQLSSYCAYIESRGVTFIVVSDMGSSSRRKQA